MSHLERKLIAPAEAGRVECQWSKCQELLLLLLNWGKKVQIRVFHVPASQIPGYEEFRKMSRNWFERKWLAARQQNQSRPQRLLSINKFPWTESNYSGGRGRKRKEAGNDTCCDSWQGDGSRQHWFLSLSYTISERATLLAAISQWWSC
jgi:hypothetical protein